ncbi:MAG: carbohydrate porin [Verrucomicrobia bacterium]|nr:carbohydrate porin [Verrucomicrobiota bacterium]
MLHRATIIILATSVSTLAAAASSAVPQTNAPPSHFLLHDSLGNVVRMSTNDVHRSLHPPPAVGAGRQIPATTKGAMQSEDVRQRIVESKSGLEMLQWFPATPPVLAPYLGSLDDFGNTAVQPGGFFFTDPLSQMAQSVKYWLSGRGLRESFYQSLTTVWMSDAASGSSTLQYYAADFIGKWAVFEVPHGGPAGWLSTEVSVQLGLSPASRTQSPQGNLGAVVNPQANVFGPNGVWISELAWQQSLLDGQLVLLAGLVDQGNYLDANSYANNSQAQFLNGAFVNNSVLPLPSNNLGLSVQWQPTSSGYLLFGTGANNQPTGQSPFQELGLHGWSYLLELGLTPENVLGLGPGVYRLQPFLATVGGQTQAGLGLNVQQQLGPNSPFACFARAGVSGSHVALGGASAQVSGGLAMVAPLKQAGLVPKLSNDLLGLGVVWSQPSATTQPVYHENEYALETFYALQLTPTIKLQPDLQVVWNRAFSPDAGPTFVCQLQINIAW